MSAKPFSWNTTMRITVGQFIKPYTRMLRLIFILLLPGWSGPFGMPLKSAGPEGISRCWRSISGTARIQTKVSLPIRSSLQPSLIIFNCDSLPAPSMRTAGMGKINCICKPGAGGLQNASCDFVFSGVYCEISEMEENTFYCMTLHDVSTESNCTLFSTLYMISSSCSETFSK